MSSRRKRREVNVPKGELGIEDRRGSAIGAPGPEPPLVDYHGDPDRCEEVIAVLIDEYGRYLEAEHALCPDCPVVCSGPLIVGSMLRWKAIHRDGRLGHWTREDIRAFLLDHLPRTVSFDPHLLGDAPTCAKDSSTSCPTVARSPATTWACSWRPSRGCSTNPSRSPATTRASPGKDWLRAEQCTTRRERRGSTIFAEASRCAPHRRALLAWP